MHTCPKGQEQVEECGSCNLIGTKCNYSCERANGFICEMAQPHYRISQTELIQENVSFSYTKAPSNRQFISLQ